MRFLSIIISISLLVYALFVLLLAAALTNWFRYPLSLEASFTLFPLLIVTPLLAFLHLRSLLSKQASKLFKILSPLSAIIVIAFAHLILMDKSTIDLLYSSPTSHVDRNDPQTISLSDSTVDRGKSQTIPPEQGNLIYHIELINPFASSHKEYLVLLAGEQEHRIPLPLFKQIPGGYASSDNPEGWATLEKTDDPNQYILNVTQALRRSRFIIDLQNDKAEEIQLLD